MLTGDKGAEARGEPLDHTANAGNALLSSRRGTPINKMFHTGRAGAITLLVAATLSCSGAGAGAGAGESTQFQVSFPASLNGTPITGRVFVTLYTKDDVEPRVAAYQSARVRVGRVPFFAVDIDQL